MSPPQAIDNDNGRELWVSDGTAGGTRLVADINPGDSNNNSFPNNFTEFDGKLYFTANDGVNGNELWVTDGTTAGTNLVADINPGNNSYGFANSSYAYNFTAFDGKLYFTANDGVNGNELWVTDGTTAGTSLLADINPGNNFYDNPNSSSPRNFFEFNDRLYFSAFTEDSGRELWTTDGTTVGTSLVADINPGISDFGSVNSSFPRDFTVIGDEVFFNAISEDIGRELFKLVIDDDRDPLILIGTKNADRLIGGNGDDIIEGLKGEDSLDGGEGNDILSGGKGRDSLNGENGNDTLLGGIDNDRLYGGHGEDSLLGETGNDTIYGGGSDDIILGGSGKDLLLGETGNDTILGGSDRDTLDGGRGNDLLSGEFGNDLFVLRLGNGSDIITDFQLGKDRLGLADDLQYEDLTFAGHNVSSGSELLATLYGVDTEHLTINDFDAI